LKTTIKGLCDSIKAMQADILMLRGEVTLSDQNLHAGSQVSDSISGNICASKWKRIAPSDIDGNEEEEAELGGMETELFELSEMAGAFIEMAFKSKLDNVTRKMQATKYGMLELQWLKCPKLDLVVFTTILVETYQTDQTASHLQQFWHDVTSPIVYVLEKADELNLQAPEVNGANANQHNSIVCRNALLTQLNPHLKQLVEDIDFKEAPPLLFEENFGILADEHTLPCSSICSNSCRVSLVEVVVSGTNGWSSSLYVVCDINFVCQLS